MFCWAMPHPRQFRPPNSLSIRPALVSFNCFAHCTKCKEASPEAFKIFIHHEYIYGRTLLWFCYFSFTPKTPVTIFDMKRKIPARMRQSETHRSDTQSPGPDPTAATGELPNYDDNGGNDGGVSTWLTFTSVKTKRFQEAFNLRRLD